MSESEYWEQLQFRMNRVEATPQELRRLGYCDWFTPKRYVLDGPSPRIAGRVGFVQRGGGTVWEFTLFLGRPVDSLATIDWATLLPPEDTTDWLHCDAYHKQIEIRPFTGIAGTL